MSNRNKNILTIVGALIIICSFGAIIGYILDQREQEALRNTFGEDIIALCNEPQSSTQTGGYPSGATKVLVLEGPRRSSFDDAVPEALRAQNRDELTIVACVEDEKEDLLESCDYEGGVVVERYIRSHDVKVYNAQTKLLINTFNVQGSVPDACDDEVFAEENEVQKERGDSPDDEAFMLAFRQVLP